MPNLHAHYYHGNVKAFKAELDGSAHRSGTGGGDKNAQSSGGGYGFGGGGGGGTSASFGKSWTLNGVGGVIRADPNERDQFGRTVLHLAAGSTTQNAWTFFSILLKNQYISINLQDKESGYTALHRALFAGNIRAAREIILRNDCDPSIRDAEGMTAFELYNGTVDGTNPPHDVDGTDLCVWGVNRNFALGTGDSSDKAFPDRVNLLTQRQATDNPDPAQRFFNIGVKDVVMAKLHTGVITTESRGNLSLCGFGSNGRLGRSLHSQLSLLPMSDFPHAVTSVALAQDHTLALTSGGYVLSWGQNRFAQLGYVIELPDRPIGLGKDDSELQVSPRRIVGPLKKEFVQGVAAGRMSSACWTEDSVWTWGTNTGHLGYEKAANPVQVLPRKVTLVSQPVIDIALSDYAMVCLLDSYEVICFHHDTTFKISFSTPRILSDAFPFRPPQSTLKPMIRKVTSCGSTFAALSSIGDVFTFILQNPVDEISKDGRHPVVKPQLIWALRKRFTAVKDVALGSDGSVIICTQAGHVYIRQRNKAGSGSLKFKHVPYLQRVVKVATNESGAYAAIRVDATPKPISLSGKTLEEDLFLLQPHFQRFEHQMTAEDFDHGKVKIEEDEEDEGVNSVVKDTAIALKMCTILRRWRSSETDSLFSWSEPLLGSDITLIVNGLAIPAHSLVLSLRIPKFANLLNGLKLDRFSIDRKDSSAVNVSVCHPLVILLLLQYVYSDDVAAIWDSRVARAIQSKFTDLQLPHAQIKADLKSLADTLELTPLSIVLESAGKTPIPSRTLPMDLQTFFSKTWQNQSSSTDMTLILADKTVECSSIILRSRCPFFESMFGDTEWTANRAGEGNVTVQMTHLKWRPMKLVFRYLHEGQEDNLFDYLHQETLDEFLDFVFEVLAAATELLLDRLILVCSRVIIRHCNVYNAASLACEANFYQAVTLKNSIFHYIITSMETMLESGLLDDMDEDTLNGLCQAVEDAQVSRLRIPRTQVLVKAAMERQKEWLSLQDIPVPRVRQPWRIRPRSPALSPVDPFTPAKGRRNRIPSSISPINSPEIMPASSHNDDIFTMDEEPPSSPSTVSGRQTPRSSRPITPLDISSGAGPSKLTGTGPVWRSTAVEAHKVDLRSVMAEAAATKTPSRPTVSSRQSTPSAILSSGAKATAGSSSPSLTPSKPPTSARSQPAPAPGPGWRPIETRKTSFTTVQSQQTPQPSPIPQRTPSSANVVQPKKVTPASSTITPKKPSGPAWTTTSNFAPTPVASVVHATSSASPISSFSSSPVTQSFSLLAIQQQERDFANQSVKKPTKSLMDIQKEEKENQAALAQEIEFQRWWDEEQAKVTKEAGIVSGSVDRGRGGSRGGRGRGDKRRIPPNRGRGGKPSGISGVSGHPDPSAQQGGQGQETQMVARPQFGLGETPGRARGGARGRGSRIPS